MHPRLLVTPFFTIYTFGVLLASAYMAAYWWLTREGRREGLDVDARASVVFWAIIGAVVGAKTLMIVRSFPEYVGAPSELFSLSLLTSAGHFYGGFIGALITAAIFFRRHPRLPFWRTAMRAGPPSRLARRLAASAASWRATIRDGQRTCPGPSRSRIQTPRASAARRSGSHYILCNCTSR